MGSGSQGIEGSETGGELLKWEEERWGEGTKIMRWWEGRGSGGMGAMFTGDVSKLVLISVTQLA